MVGTIGNILSLIIMCTKKIRSSTTSLYLRVLAVVDLTILYTGLLQLYIKNFTGYDIRLGSRMACKFQMFYGYFILQFNSWLIVTVTLERLFAVIFPHKCKQIFSKNNACWGLLIKLLSIIGLNFHFFVTYDLLVISNKPVCAPTSEPYRMFMIDTWPWIDFCIDSLVPFILILMSTVIIIVSITMSRYRPQGHSHSHHQIKLTSLTTVLLLVSLTFFLTTAPISIYLIRHRINSVIEDSIPDQSVTCAVLNMLYYTNNAGNFFLYIMAGSRFRKELSKLCCHQNTVSPSNTHELGYVNG